MEGEDGEGTVYLGVEDVLLLHANILGGSIEQVRDHLRNTEGLEGAVARPLSHAHYAGADVSVQTAVLAHGIAEDQLFVNGNKRTALAAALTFLDLAGHPVAAWPPVAVRLARVGGTNQVREARKSILVPGDDSGLPDLREALCRSR